VEKNKLIIGAVGDVAVFHHEPEIMFDAVASELQKADLSFAQNERHYTNANVTPVSGFTEQADPEHARYLKKGGFDVLSFASNHCMDLGEEPMMETIGALRKQGFTVIGAGRNLEEATKPAIFEKNGLKVGFLAYCSVLRPSYDAGTYKPGAAPMRAYTLYHQTDYQPGTPPRIRTFPYKEDLAAMCETIQKVKEQVDILVLSCHWGLHFVHAMIADYEKEVGHAAIDAGADIVIGSHPHILKGIEVYKGKPIFYSMGNFAFDLPAFVLDDWVKKAPHHLDVFRDQKWAYGDPKWSIYTFPAEGRSSMIVRFTYEDGKLARAAYVPVEINEKAQPIPVEANSAKFDEAVTYMKDITASQGFKTEFTVEGNEVVVKL
jgi:poly-gamma-glutamate synthesis protein (capsule biosynthesis protein)